MKNELTVKVLVVLKVFVTIFVRTDQRPNLKIIVTVVISSNTTNIELLVV
jgi:hypothetical protein